VNSKSVRALKTNWAKVLSNNKGHFIFSLNGWDARKNPDAIPFLMCDSEPLKKPDVSKLDSSVDISKVAFGPLTVDRSGNLVFVIDKSSTLKAETALKAGIKHFGKLAKSGDGPLKELASLTQLSKLAKPKTQTGGDVLKVEGLSTDDELAKSAKKTNYTKSKKAISKKKTTEEKLADKSSFNALLFALKKWHTTYEDKLSRENVMGAQAGLVEIGKLAATWKEKHDKDWLNKDRKKAIKNIIERLKVLNEEIKQARAVWAKADDDFTIESLAEDALDTGSELKPEDRVENLDKALEHYAKQLKEETDPEELEALTNRLEELKEARSESLKTLQEEGGKSWTKLDKAWDRLAEKDNPTVREQITLMSKKVLESTSEISKDLVRGLGDETIDGGERDALLMRATALADEVLQIARKAGEDLDVEAFKAPINAVEEMLFALEKYGDTDEVSDIRDKLKDGATQLTKALIIHASRHGGEGWAGALGRGNDHTSKIRAAYVRFEGREAANTLLGGIVDDMEAHKTISAPQIVYTPPDLSELNSKLQERVMAQIAPITLDMTSKTSFFGKQFPNLATLANAGTGLTYPSVGDIITDFFVTFPEKLLAYTNTILSDIQTITGTHIDAHDVLVIVKDRVARGLPLDKLSVIQSMPAEKRGSDHTLKDRLLERGIIDGGDDKLQSDGMSMIDTFEREVPIAAAKHAVKHKETYDLLARILKASLDPLLAPKKLRAVPESIRALCLETVNTTVKQGASEKESYNLVADILLLRWLVPIVSFSGGKFEAGSKPKPNKLSIQLGALMQCIGNGTKPKGLQQAPLVPVVEEYTRKFNTYVKAMIADTATQTGVPIAKSTWTMGDLSWSNPVLYYDTTTAPYNYMVNSGDPGGSWSKIEQFCSLLSVYWLKAPKTSLKFSDLSSKQQQEASETLSTMGGKGLQSQVSYAKKELGGASKSLDDITSEIATYPTGTQFWFGSDAHVRAARILGADAVQIYDSNDGGTETKSKTAFLGVLASGGVNTYVVR